MGKIDIAKIKRLKPPDDAIKRFIEKDKQRIPKNPIKKFFKLFFGEGF